MAVLFMLVCVTSEELVYTGSRQCRWRFETCFVEVITIGMKLDRWQKSVYLLGGPFFLFFLFLMLEATRYHHH